MTYLLPGVERVHEDDAVVVRVPHEGELPRHAALCGLDHPADVLHLEEEAEGAGEARHPSRERESERDA
jgi:hypothetical protein